MAVTYDSTTDTYSMTFTDFETWLPNQSDNTVSTPYNVFITEYTQANVKGEFRPLDSTHTFESVLYNSLTKYVNIKLEENNTITNATYMFRSCSNLVSIDITGMKNLTNAVSAFFGCSNLKTANISGLDKLENAGSIFRACTNLIIANIDGLSSLSIAAQMFYGCNSIVTVNLRSLKNLTDANTMFSSCESLTSLSNFPSSNNAINVSSIFQEASSLFNIGIIRNLNTGRNDRLYGTNIKAAGVLVSSLSAYDLQDWNGTKFYTTSQYYSGLSSELATDYPNSNFEVIEVDACLDYDELGDWLEAQPQNTAETPYKIFIGGGLSADKVKGYWSDYSFTSVIPSDLSNIIITNGKYVDLSCIQLPSDCTDLTAAVSGKKTTIDLTETKQQYITKFCEIPSSVTTAKAFAMYSNGLKSFGDDNVIPSSVTNAQKFLYNTDNIGYVKIEHQLTNNSNYQDWVLDSNTKIYAKDYTYFKNYYSTLHNNRQIILECDYSDLDTYLGWFRNSCESVNLKVNGLVEANLIGSGTASPFTASALCSKLLGTNISNSTVKGYVAASTFDLRLTEIPSTQTSLLGCFQNGNVKYSFEIPSTVTNMKGTFADSPLAEAPILPSGLTTLESTFAGTNLTVAPTIPSAVTNMEGAFFRTSLSEMPDIPSGVTTLVKAFQSTNIVNTKEIPSSVTDLEECFAYCTSLEEVTNVPASVTDLTDCFRGCTALETINGWAVDVENATMTNCFSNCTNLTEINTICKQSDSLDKWVHFTVKTDSTDNTKYNITARDLRGNSDTIQVDKAVIYSYLTDEILFSPNGTLSDSYITDMLNYKYPFGGGLDPANKNFVLWAAQGSTVKQNLSSQSGFTGSDINVSNNNTTKIANIIGALTGDITQQGKVYSAQLADALASTLAVADGGTGATTILGILQNLRNGVTGVNAGNEQNNYNAYITASKFTTTSGYVKYSNGLIIQWGQFNNPANVNQKFPISFTQTPIMACSYTYTGNNNVYYSDFPRPVDNQYWTIPHTDSKNIGLWIAIGY